jgi:hypothetical protein
VTFDPVRAPVENRRWWAAQVSEVAMLVDEARAASRPAVDRVVRTLIAEYAGRCPAGVVLGEVFRAREMLLAHGVRAGLAEATAAAARLRVERHLAPAQPTVERPARGRPAPDRVELPDPALVPLAG